MIECKILGVSQESCCIEAAFRVDGDWRLNRIHHPKDNQGHPIDLADSEQVHSYVEQYAMANYKSAGKADVEVGRFFVEESVIHEEIDALGRHVLHVEEALVLEQARGIELNAAVAGLNAALSSGLMALRRDLDLADASLQEHTRKLALQEAAHLSFVGKQSVEIAGITGQVHQLLTWYASTLAWNALPWWKRWWLTIRGRKVP